MRLLKTGALLSYSKESIGEKALSAIFIPLSLHATKEPMKATPTRIIYLFFLINDGFVLECVLFENMIPTKMPNGFLNAQERNINTSVSNMGN